MPALPKSHALGLVWAVTAIAIWSGSLVMLRFGVTTSLNAFDLTALRVGVASLVLMPVIFRRGFALGQLGIGGLLIMVVGFGAPYILLISLGLKTAPASAAGSLNPGVMAVVSVLLGWKILGDRVGPVRVVGGVAILVGAAFFASLPGAEKGVGHLILIVTGIMWAGYTLVVRRAGIPALHATAIVAVGSAILYLPIYVAALPKQLSIAPLPDIAAQAIFQGMFVSVVAVFAFNRSSELLGSVAGATLPALIPLVTLGLGAVMLDERAGIRDFASATLIGGGVALILAGHVTSRRSLATFIRKRVRDS
ncbi:DMT family transporter [Halomonas elongata]|uniref:DMT family transporter n=1 Tax=Halomonas elongata TaxID=2746 RepID=UPI00255AE009|nr:DMT family transporter [Halomonas elongata]MDL4862987.1 DMT family transporter [Halomonas elongata]